MVLKIAKFSKIVLLGDGAVGKTALRNSFMGKGFTSNYLMTLGADMSSKLIEELDLKYQIWDMAGQPRFKEVRRMFYNGSAGAIIVFDVTRYESYENTTKWIMELQRAIPKKTIPIVLLGNKTDLRETISSSMSYQDGEKLAKDLTDFYAAEQWQIPYFETSAKTGINVQEAFVKLGRMILNVHW
ncbi:MAG: GTPase KRas precursor [Candidatus Heimdallarchaeota archaeon LC_3]|nr:MAG: GTPase KRas precursor [Candidatus Heimdallarchaeota archaeon LC_3]